MFTIEDARRVQRDLKLGDVHVACIDLADGFVLAHTDDERASGTDLRMCEIHRWLAYANPRGLHECCFPLPGWYQVSELHDAKGLAL